MKISINQPYFFPHLKYFQLIYNSDIFVVYDDVQFTKKGWINKNRLNNNKFEKKIVFPVSKHSQKTMIKDIKIAENSFSNSLNKIINSIEKMYKNSNEKEFTIDLISRSLNLNTIKLDEYLIFYIKELCEYLDIDYKILRSSEVEYLRESDFEEKIISLLKKLNGNYYLNLDGGRELYTKSKFVENNIKLEFISDLYAGNKNLVDNFSVISHLLNDGKEQTMSYISGL